MAGLHSDASGSTVLRYAYTLRPTQCHCISHLHMHMPSDQISLRRVALTQSSLCPGNCYLTCRAVRVPAVVADDQFAWHGCATYPDVRMIPRQPSPRMAVYSDLTGTGGAQLLNHGVSTELIPISILRVSVWGEVSPTHSSVPWRCTTETSDVVSVLLRACTAFVATREDGVVVVRPIGYVTLAIYFHFHFARQRGRPSRLEISTTLPQTRRHPTAGSIQFMLRTVILPIRVNPQNPGSFDQDTSYRKATAPCSLSPRRREVTSLSRSHLCGADWAAVTVSLPTL